MVLVVEHGSSAGGRWLRRYRARLALWIAVAAALLLFYVLLGRNLPTDTLRQVAWIAAVSQIFVALLPALLALVTIAAVVALAVLALVALALLAVDRR